MPVFCVSWVHCHGYLSCTLVRNKVFLGKWDFTSLDIMYESVSISDAYFKVDQLDQSILHQKDVNVDFPTHINVSGIFSHQEIMPQMIYTYGLYIKWANLLPLWPVRRQRIPLFVLCFYTLLHWQPSPSSQQVICLIALYVHSFIQWSCLFWMAIQRNGAVCTMAHMWKAHCLKEVAEKEVKCRA